MKGYAQAVPQQGHKDRLSAVDASFLAQEKQSSHMHVGALVIFDGPAPSQEEFRAHLEARVGELLPVPGHEVQARLDVRAQVLVGRRRALEGHHRPDVHVRPALLLVEKRHVHRAEPLHVGLSHLASLVAFRAR